MDENHQDKTESKGATTEDKSHLPPFSPQDERDEKEAQEELARLRKRLQKNGNGIFKATHKRTGFEDKTLWDKLSLFGTLAIPLVVALATIGFGWWQAQLAQQQHQSDQMIALDQQQATILQTYIDNIQDLLLNHNLLKSSPDIKNPYYDVAILARARTLTALQGLDPERKGRLVQFLDEAQLIGFAEFTQNGELKLLHAPIIILSGADLNGALLNGAFLYGAFLYGVHLNGALLYGADLVKAALSYADLSNVHLNGALLNDALLNNAHLSFAFLNGAHLSNADLGSADLHDADLSGADLSGAILFRVNLRGANLSRANLSEADLLAANLYYANLNGAHNLTQQQLDQVYSCKNAILPSGLTCHQNL